MNTQESRLDSDTPRARQGYGECEATYENGDTLSEHGGTVKPREVTRFTFTDEAGKPLYYKVRYEPGKNGGKKSFQFFHGDNQPGRGGEPVLYNLPNVPKAEVVIVTEGEAKADLLNSWGMVATSMDSGAGSNLTDEMIAQLSGRRIVILRDNDEPGLKFAEKTARALVNECPEVKVVLLPGLPEKGDIIDWAKEPGNDWSRLAQIIAQAEPWKDEGPAKSGYKALTISSFLSINLPERGCIINPVVPEQGLVMVYGPRGNGKTWFVLQMAYGTASGGMVVNHWEAPKPRRVLYIDGEMPARTMQERLASIVAGSDKEPPDPSYLSIITPDLQDMAMPNLAHQAGQEALEPLVQNTDVVIVDNLACLARHGRENDSESWLPVQTWLLSLRRQGKSVITVHHAGKGGAQRGTSSREDVLDTVISLRRPKDYDPSEGARFEVHLEKARGVYGPEAAPFEAALRTERGAAIWTCRTLEDSVKAQVLALKAEEYSIRDIATETGLSRSKVQRILKGAES